MSEGRSSPATLQEQRKPTRRHVNLLHEIILRAQQDPLIGQSPKDALLNAYSTVFEEHHLDVLQDSVCFWTLLKIIDPGVPSGSLYEKFENVLKDEGIELSFDDDAASYHGTIPSFSYSHSPSQAAAGSHVLHQEESDTGRRPSSVQSWQQPGRMNLPANVPEPAKVVNYDEYMDNPPAHISQLMQVAEAMDRKTLLRQSLAVLQPRGVSEMISHAQRICENRLRGRALWHWRNVSFECQERLEEADSYYESAIKRKFMLKFLDAARTQRIQAMDEERLKGMALYKMTLTSREAYLRRKADAKLLAKYLGRLTEAVRKYQLQNGQLASILDQHSTRWSTQVLRPAVATLRQSIENLTDMERTADEHYDKKLKNRAMVLWISKSYSAKQAQAVSADVRDYFLKRKYLLKLKKAANAKKDRRTVIARWVLSRWRNFCDVKKHNKYDEAYKKIRKKLKMNLARRLLLKWTDRSRAISDLDFKADELQAAHARQLAHKAVVHMYDRSQLTLEREHRAIEFANRLVVRHTFQALARKTERVQQMREIADRIQVLHNQQIAAGCLKQLNMKAFEIKRRERDAEAFRQRHDKRALRTTVEKLSLAAFQRRGEEPLRLPPATPARRRAEEINRLTMGSTTPIYTPAISANYNADTRLSFTARLRGEINPSLTSHQPIDEMELDEAGSEQVREAEIKKER